MSWSYFPRQIYLLIFSSALLSSFIWLTASITKPHTQYLERIQVWTYDKHTVNGYGIGLLLNLKYPWLHLLDFAHMYLSIYSISFDLKLIQTLFKSQCYREIIGQCWQYRSLDGKLWITWKKWFPNGWVILEFYS